MTQPHRPLGVTLILAFHLLNLILWGFGQTWAVFDYDRVAGWGLQDPRALLDPVIVEVNRAIGLSDTLVLLPLFAVALAGLWRMRAWGVVASWMAFAITLYWPVVFWTSQGFFAAAGITHAPTAAEYVFIPGAFWLIAAWGAWYLYRRRALFFLPGGSA